MQLDIYIQELYVLNVYVLILFWKQNGQDLFISSFIL